MASRFLTPLPVARGWLADPVFQLQREIDRVFEDVFSGATAGGGAGRSGNALMAAPRIDLQDSEGELRLHADLPGVQPSDLDVRVEGDVLTIRGERKSESERNEQNYHVMERSHGRFQRSIQLPFAPDPQQVQASVREGVLEIRIPKRAPQERSRRIEVRSADSQPGSLTGSGGGGSSSANTGSSAGASASSAAGSSGSGMGGSAMGGSGAGASDMGDSGAGGRGSVAAAVGADGTGSGSGTGGGGGAEGGSNSTGQGPGGSSSVTPGTGAGAAGGSGGGLAGVAGGPTNAPVGESESSR